MLEDILSTYKWLIYNEMIIDDWCVYYKIENDNKIICSCVTGMDNEELPDYKVTFLKEMDELRQQQTKEELQMATASKIGQNESQHA